MVRWAQAQTYLPVFITCAVGLWLSYTYHMRWRRQRYLGELERRATTDPNLRLFLDAYLREQARVRVHRPVGTVGLRVITFLYSKKACERIFFQIVADMREQINDDLLAGRRWRVRWALIRGNADLMLSACAYTAGYIVKRLSAVWKLIG